MGNVHWIVQGKYRGEWKTLFTLPKYNDAIRRLRALRKDNPACEYRARWQSSGEPIVAIEA